MVVRYPGEWMLWRCPFVAFVDSFAGGGWFENPNTKNECSWTSTKCTTFAFTPLCVHAVLVRGGHERQAHLAVSASGEETNPVENTNPTTSSQFPWHFGGVFRAGSSPVRQAHRPGPPHRPKFKHDTIRAGRTTQRGQNMGKAREKQKKGFTKVPARQQKNKTTHTKEARLPP